MITASNVRVRGQSRAGTKLYFSATNPTDWLEGAGEGTTLWPPSLFEAQLALRTSNGVSSLPLP